MSRDNSPQIKRESLKTAISQRRQAAKNIDFVPADDPYETANNAKTICRNSTGLIYYPNIDHHNPWVNYPECPERATEIYSKLEEMGLTSRCKQVELNRDINIRDLLIKTHGNEMVENLYNICCRADLQEAEQYDCVYYNGEKSAINAEVAALACVSLTSAVSDGLVQNGFAVIRPPGHHSYSEPNGYCLFNNVAICADYLLSKSKAKKILIVDVDVHHGQGTQRKFYSSNNVLYFSIHRYEYGLFWPHLKESSFSYIGENDGKGYNINIPLNEAGIGDTEYLSIVLNVLLPAAYEFNPDYILVSAGYDACLGCPEGQMKVTPTFYGHLVSLLSGLANGKLVCLLEGGYFLPSLAEGAACTLKALLGDPCAPLKINKCIKLSVVESINNAKFCLRDYWNCFKIDELSPNLPFQDNFNALEDHLVIERYFGEEPKPPYTMYSSPSADPRDEIFKQKLAFIRSYYSPNKTEVLWTYSEKLLLHDSNVESQGQEKPGRLSEIITKLQDFNLTPRMKFLPINLRDVVPLIQSVHDNQYVDNMLNLRNIKERPDLYYNASTPDCIRLAISGVISLVDEMKKREHYAGASYIRPPGHHAESACSSGFCFFNNAVIAARYLVDSGTATRVLIVDFDIHHGDGTQSLTYDRNDIMYISVHRFDNGKYFPAKQSANYHYVGQDRGTGYNMNIPFNKVKMNDIDYLTVWIKLVLPVAYTYCPDYIIVSAGFDAGINDTLGGYKVSPEMFGHLIQLLKSVSKIMMILEGGYNYETTSLSMTMCTKALIGDPIPAPTFNSQVHEETKETIKNVLKVQKMYWPVLQVNKRVVPNVYTEEDLHKLRLATFV